VRSRLSPIADAILGPFVRRKLREPIKTSAGKLTREQLDAIADECDAPRENLQIDGSDLLILPSDDIMITGRLLKALQATGQTTMSEVTSHKHRTPEIR